jgi:hypothetical protein
MKQSFLLALLLCVSVFLYSQSRKSIRVRAGEDVAQAYSKQGFYYFPKFSKGTLFFKEGGKNSGQLFNYNVLAGTMQFIGTNGDTLTITNASNIDSLVFENTGFINDDGFMEIAAHADSILLLKKITIKTHVENIGAYGQPNQTGSIDNIRNMPIGTNVYSFSLAQDIVINENINWLLYTRGKKPVKANKSNLLKLLPANKQTRAEHYIAQNKPNFENEADLKRLFAEINK